MPARPTSRPVILIVDDAEEIREIAAELLTASGFATLCAANGREALATLAKASDIALILLDLNMPLVNGYRFLEFKEKDPLRRHLPVIIFSADLNIDYLNNRDDVVAIISKLTPMKSLVECIRKTLGME